MTLIPFDNVGISLSDWYSITIAKIINLTPVTQPFSINIFGTVIKQNYKINTHSVYAVSLQCRNNKGKNNETDKKKKNATNGQKKKN